MAAVGLLPPARIALQVGRAVLPRYRSGFSKRQFTQPQLLATLCLMRYEDWTFRQAQVRLGEHRELCQVLRLVSVPDFTTLYRFLQRLDDQAIDRAVGETVRRFAWFAAHADASSPAARIEFQSVSVETSPPFPEDVNRATKSVDEVNISITLLPQTVQAELPVGGE